MKTKLFISVLFSSYALISLAQVDSVSKQKSTKMKRWTIGVNVNTVEPITEAGFTYIVSQRDIFDDPSTHRKDKSFSLGLNASFKINEDCALRLSARTIQYKIDETYDQRETIPAPTSDYLLDDGHIRQSVYVISPGIIWNFNYKKLNLYGGFQFIYKKYSSTEINLRYGDYNSSNDSLIANDNYIIKESGGYSMGIGPIVGFSVTVLKCFSIGGEFSIAYTHYKRGGETSWSKMTTYPPAFAGNGGTIISHGSYEANKFSSILSSVNISYNF